MNAVVVVLIGLSNTLELGGDTPIIQPLARGRVFLQQVGPDHGATEVFRNQPPDLSRFDDVAPHPLKHIGRRREIGRDDVTPGEAILDNFHETDIGRKNGPHTGPVYTRYEENLVGNLFKRSKKLRRKHVAIAGHQRHQHSIGAAEFLLVLKECLHVLMLQRKLLFEPGLDA